MVRFFNVSFSYPRSAGVENINLYVKNGEFVFLTGPSGAGKSTVLKLIYLEEFPQRGNILLDGYNTQEITRKDIPYIRRKIGMVFQDFRLLRDRNVFENIAFALRIIGVRRSRINKRVLEILRDVGLSHKKLKMPQALSGGEQQRVAIARALVNEPFVILADEPTGNLDEENREEILALLHKINERGTSIIMATHNYEMAKKTGRRVIRIDKGKIIS
ncbi:cell division ATP-binding protein FtsE [bacterium BMS3Abin05]|nr:cell division ATP-binding protein FtsE [bacterium BMS3Abin05]GBE28465.1 cell division ATP-binding protein FtsE [bacterium BMS3Bbin03]HDK35533.1 cell division ATP-binding protein FtsE [Bacteroidota bacterium]HDL79017.1 cell division ATP-binding protein FtsE [Bacteroidota bacterium]HDZ12511.1 cell division ATP-binding protein FtsE [Bacteroidota bacterium]